MEKNLAKNELFEMFDELDLNDSIAATSVVAKLNSNVIGIIASPVVIDYNLLAKTGHIKLKKMIEELNDMFMERKIVIDNIMRAIIVGQHVLLLGPPGTGKLIDISF